jgi:tetratricopeptide (TPR) repeat protein
MSAHLERARLLLAQSRAADAEREVMLALAAEPNDAAALALLALTRASQEKHEAALPPAEEAVGLAPDNAYFHYVRAFVLHRMDRDDDAFAAIQESLRLDPHDPNIFALLAGIQLGRRNWPAALEAAETALGIDPEHIQAANLRSMALVRLGRRAEAMQTVASALQRDPDNAVSHANQGWNCLHRNDPKRAQEHFREALRLDPELEYAREGMLQALKARNPIYRGMLAYFLWISRVSRGMQWGFIAALWFGTRLVRERAVSSHEQAWIWWTLLALMYGFVYLSWTAQPMFNLLLRVNRFGRHVLSHDQRMASNWFGGCLVGAGLSLAWTVWSDSSLGFIAMLGFVVLSICVAATFSRLGRARVKLGIATGTLAAVGIAGVVAVLVGRGDLAGQLGLIFAYGFLGFQLFANFGTR